VKIKRDIRTIPPPHSSKVRFTVSRQLDVSHGFTPGFARNKDLEFIEFRSSRVAIRLFAAARSDAARSFASFMSNSRTRSARQWKTRRNSRRQCMCFFFSEKKKFIAVSETNFLILRYELQVCF